MCLPVGVANTRKIPDDRITASSFYNNVEKPEYGRLNGDRGVGVWCPKTISNRSDYLQVDMGSALSVCAVATQGSKTQDFWTPTYKLQLSLDGSNWEFYEENDALKVRNQMF